MDPQTAQQLLDALHPTATGRIDTLRRLLQRDRLQAPLLLELAAGLPGLPGLAEGDAQLQAALPALASLPAPGADIGAPLAWAEPPEVQARRVVDALLAGARGQPVAGAAQQAAALADAHGRQFGLSPLHAAHAARAAAASMHWLADAAAAGAGAGVRAPFNAWEPSGAQEGCRLPLALLDDAGRGVAGWLQLWRVHRPGARLCLAPAPASALLLRVATHADIARGATWDAALARVHDCLQLLLTATTSDAAAAGPHPLLDTAIAWDVALPSGPPLGLLQGDSASAALLLGAVWLMRRHARPPWRALLLRLLASDLQHTACSAALGLQGTDLAPVGGALDKAAGLQPLADLLASQPGTPRLVLHVSSRLPWPSIQPQGVKLQPQTSLLALLQDVVQAADPLTPEQSALLDTLRQQDPDAAWPASAPQAGDVAHATDGNGNGNGNGNGDGADHPARVAAAAAATRAWLDQLAVVHAQPATRLRTWLLHCWAAWERDQGGRVQQRHVLLQVKPDALGEGQGQLHLGPTPQGDDSLDTLPGLLARFDGSARHQAYTLRGLPGAGKSTLLRHHLQRSAHRLLQALDALAQPAGAAARSQAPGALLPADACELPVYLRLGDVTLGLGGAGNTAAARLALWHWVLAELRKQGAPHELLQLLQGRGEWAALGLRPRLLLDGLNELQVANPDYRPTRAAMVLDAVHQHLGRPLPATADAPLPARPAGVPAPLPFLVASRTDPSIAACGVVLLRLDVRPWRPEDVGAYLARRLGEAEGQRRLAALQQVPNALELCRTPMHLALQCDLWEHGFNLPVEDRATLYAAWLWQRLHRALFPPEGSPPADCWADPQPDDPADPAHPTQTGHAQQVLLTADDRQAIQHCRSHSAARLRQLPRRGVLLRTLAAQAASQWWADADGGVAGGERTAAQVPWDDPDDLDDPDDGGQPHPLVAASLPPGLRRRFGDACVALGLVQLDRVASNTWCFSHQSWGEYLASTTLLLGRPGSDAGRDARLLARLQPPPLPGTSDAEHLRSLARQGSDAWQQVPQAVWDALAPALKAGEPLQLQVPTKDFVEQFFRDPAANPSAVEAMLARIRSHANFEVNFSDGTWQVDDTTGTVALDLRVYGDTYGISAKLNLRDRAAWRQPGARGAGWQALLQQDMAQSNNRAFSRTLWNELLPRLLAEAGCPSGLLAQLQAQQGRLEPAPQADGAEVLGLALAGLGSDATLRAWLHWLLLYGAWPALQRVLPVLRQRLEPEAEVGSAGHPTDTRPRAWRAPDPALHWLRRLLLLTSVDAGAAALPGLQAGGVPDLLDAPWPVPMPQPLQTLWRDQLRPAAFQGTGRRLAHRLQAGLMLGQLGDTLRFEPRPLPQQTGQPPPWCLRPVRALWAPVGAAAGPTAYTIGSAARDGNADERPQWTVALAGFLACRLPLTVGEWQRFHATPAGQAHRWDQQHDPDFNNPLQPVTGIDWHAARAYAHWADAALDDWRQTEAGDGWAPLQLALPTELHWEAAVRGPRHAPSAGPTGWVDDDPAAFNHAPTRWLRPSPVGVFSASATPLGLQDAAGNAWEWCANAVDNESMAWGWQQAADCDLAGSHAEPGAAGLRALRGGACHYSTNLCRPAYRSRDSPDVHYYDFGVRLVRLWLPHSEHWTPSPLEG